jgi:hypothetical protein
MSAEDVLARIRKTGTITADDALEARKSVYGGDSRIEPGEIETLFRMDEAAKSSDRTWTELLDEAGADYLVHQEPPEGYVSEANADWLARRIAEGDVVKTPRLFDLLVHILDQAVSAPSALSGLALKQVRLAVVDGAGPLAGDGGLVRGRIGGSEVEVLRRVLYAFGGEGGIAVTRAEAEVLFDLNDATAAADNDPVWNELFVKAIANYVMAASGYSPPSRAVALEHEHWLDSPTEGVGGFFERIARGGLSGILNAYKAPGPEGDRADRTAKKIEEFGKAEVVSEDEAAWLSQRIGRDGQFTSNEKALLRFIRDEAPSVPPVLAPLIEKAA